MRYFECNLPSDISFLEEGKCEEMKMLITKIKARMDKLEEAKDLSSLRGEDFSKAIKPIFDAYPEQFDQMSSGDLSLDALRFFDGEEEPERIEWENADVVCDTAFLKREEWELLRHLGIGGSEAAVIDGSSPFKDIQSLYYEKRGKENLLEKEDPMRQGIFDRGHFVEDKVIQAFCKLQGAIIHKETRMFRSFEYPAATANIDAIIEVKGELYIFEAKTTFTSNYAHWASSVPVYYLPQTHQYPAVLNDKRIKGTFIGCLFTDDLIVGGLFCGSNWSDKDFVYRFIPRNEEEERRILEEEQTFWDENILKGIRPKAPSKQVDLENSQKYVTGYPSDTHAKRLDNTSEMKELIKEYKEASDSYQRAKKTLESKEEVKKDLQAKLIEKLEQSQKGLMDLNDDKYIEMTYKAPKARAVTNLEMLEVRFPEAYKDCISFQEQQPRFYFKEKAKFKGWDKDLSA